MDSFGKEDNDIKSDALAIPPDFPRPNSVAAIGGAGPKLLLSMEDGRYYSKDSTPSAMRERWLKCEDLAIQFAGASRKTKAEKRSHMSQQDILDQYFNRLIIAGWTSNDEAKWIIRRCADILGWPAPGSVDL